MRCKPSGIAACQAGGTITKLPPPVPVVRLPGDANTSVHIRVPAPKGDFILVLRMYWPKEQAPSILDGSWKPPPVVRV